MKKNRAMRLVSMVLAISTLLVSLRVFAVTAGGMAANGKYSIRPLNQTNKYIGRTSGTSLGLNLQEPYIT